MYRLKVPRTIDKPPMMMFWSFDQVIIIGIIMGFGVLAKKVFIALLIGLFVAGKYKRMVEGKLRMYQLHWFYWNGGIMQDASNSCPAAYKKEFIS